MPIVPFVPPQRIAPPAGYFDYITVDAQRRRVYAAHGGGASLLIVNAGNGKLLGQVHVGRMAGVAVNEATGHVYTGDGKDDAVSEVDPVAMKEVHRLAVPGPVDAIAYDAGLHRIYADEDDGNRVFVIDTRTFAQVGTVIVPGHKPEYLAIDPKTHAVYQNIATNREIAVIDPRSLKVVRTIATPEIADNHPLQLDSVYRMLVVGGGGKLSTYSLQGKRLQTRSFPRADQCSLDERRQLLACAGKNVYLYKLSRSGKAVLLAERRIAPHMHNVAIDGRTGRLWTTWATGKSGYVQGFVYSH